MFLTSIYSPSKSLTTSKAGHSLNFCLILFLSKGTFRTFADAIDFGLFSNVRIVLFANVTTLTLEVGVMMNDSSASLHKLVILIFQELEFTAGAE